MGPTPSATSTNPPGGVSRRWSFAVLAVAFLFVLMPFLLWQSTWFGRPLTDAEIQKNLADLEHPRKIQHALSQIADRIVARDPQVRRWYPQVAALAHHNVDEIRLTAAWVIGQDNSVPEFHQTLLRLLEDPHPMVRRNAALSLVRFKDATGRREIVAMLRSFGVATPGTGTLAQRLKVGDTVNPGTLLARIKVKEEELEVRSQVPGRLERWAVGEGVAVQSGQEIVLLAPSAEMVWEALRALVLIGTAEDIPDVERYLRPVEGMSDKVHLQARATLGAIRARAPTASEPTTRP